MPQPSATYSSFRRNLRKWKSNYHSVRLEKDPLAWADEQAWDEVQANEFTEMVVASAGMGCSALTRALLSHGGEAARPDKDGTLPIFAAAGCCSAATMELLVAHGARLDAHDSKGRGLLHAVADNGGISNWGGHYAGAMGWLLERGLDASEPDAQGNTPLHLAARSLNESVHQKLISHGADWASLNRAGKCAADLLFEAFGGEHSGGNPEVREWARGIRDMARAKIHAQSMDATLPGGGGRGTAPRL